MSRPTKPLSMQSGNLTRQQQIEKELAENHIKVGSKQLEKPPKWVKKTIAKKEWKRLVAEMKPVGIWTNLDVANLGVYCNAYASYVEATEKLNEEECYIEYTNNAGETNLIEHPAIKTQLKYSDEMRKYAVLLGLSVDSRLKLAKIKVEETKNDIEKDFGDI